MKTMIIKEEKNIRQLFSENYKYVFNTLNGSFARWGKTQEDDPDMSIYGPEIADIEITEICNGIRLDAHDPNSPRQVCKFCYKANTPQNTNNMSFETFKKLFDNLCSRKAFEITVEQSDKPLTLFYNQKVPYKGEERYIQDVFDEIIELGKLKLPIIKKEKVIKPWKVLTQIAFGADAQAIANPDLWKMMDYCRNNPYNLVVPNITVADIDDEVADKLAKHCGAVAVSCYMHQNKDCCYESVKKLTDRGMKQCNIHMMISEESYEDTLELFDDVKKDERLKGLNAVVLLSLKQKGRGVSYNSLSIDKFKTLVDVAFENKIGLGFDSCSCFKFLESVKERDNYKELYEMSEPCESSLFSSYINWKGDFYPCSFTEGEKCENNDWTTGISTTTCKDFLTDVWHHPKTQITRNEILQGRKQCKSCFHYNV